MNRTLEKLKNDPRVEDVSDERACGNGIIITMRGYTNDPIGACHVFAEDTPTKALAYLRRCCVPCACSECNKTIALIHNLEIEERDLRELAEEHASLLPKISRTSYISGFQRGFSTYDARKADWMIFNCTEKVAADQWRRIYDPIPDDPKDPHFSLLRQYQKLAWLMGFVTGYNYAPLYNEAHQNYLDSLGNEPPI